MAGRRDHSLLALALALVAIDAAVVVAARNVDRPRAAAAGAEQAAATAGGWQPDHAARIGARAAELFVAIGRNLDGSGRVRVAVRRAGDDVAIAVSTVALPHAVVQGFPPRVYCLRCDDERCRFDGEALAAIEAMVTAVPAAGVQALADELAAAEPPAPRLRAVITGGASAGRVFRWNSVHTCISDEEITLPRHPPAYDVYAQTCGAAECEVAGSGERVAVAAGDIRSNAQLACLRAACLLDASSLAGLDRGRVAVDLVADVAFEDGGANRGGEIAIVIPGIAAPEAHEAYRAFWTSFERGVLAEPATGGADHADEVTR
jgi:hypothetical protein